MSEPSLISAPDTPHHGEPSILQELESFRRQGAQRFDPVRFHYMEALARRMQAQPLSVQRVLKPKLKSALAKYAEGLMHAQKAASDEVATLSSRRPEQALELRRLFAAGDYASVRRIGRQAGLRQGGASLAQLNHYIQSTSQAGSPAQGVSHVKVGSTEMKSLHRFRQTWARMSAEDEVDKALSRAPENAGPLNSHSLALRSLALMRELSPDYLRRFLAHLDTLLWLDHMNQTSTSLPVKPVRRAR